MAKYQKFVQVGYKADGSRIRKHVRANTKSELDKKIRELYAESAKVSNPSGVRFGPYANKWYETYKLNKGAATRQMYRNALRKTAPLDLYEVRKITKSDCQILLNEYAGTRTAEILRMTLKQIFATAIEDGIIAYNPANKLELQKRTKAEKRAFTDEEKERIQNAELKPMERMFVTILMSLGLRPGEALALTPSDFDFKASVLHVTKSVEFDGNNPKIKGTKTGVNRTIPLPDGLLKYIRKYIREEKSILLFHMQNGSLMSKSSYVKFSQRILGAIGIEGITMYHFRHNRATELYYLCQKGIISTKKAAELMGHSEPIFLQTYSHIDESKENVEALYQDLQL